MTVGIDSNVILRILVGDDLTQEKMARESIRNSTEACLIDCSVLGEVIWVLERGYKLSKPEIIRTVEALLRTSDFTFEDKDSIWRALEDYRVSSAGFVDCLIGRRNSRSGCDTTLTFDRKAGKLKTYTLLQDPDKSSTAS